MFWDNQLELGLGACSTLDRDNHFLCVVDNDLVEVMRENNFADMTVVEQLVRIREDVCEYACKYREEAKKGYSGDVTMQRLAIQRYCHECPLGKIHYSRKQLY